MQIKLNNMINSKKGAIGIPLNVIITLIISSLVLVGMLGIVYGSGSSESFEKQILATDTALLIDSIYAAKGNLFVIYPKEQDFIFNFKPNNVEVSGGKTQGKRSQFFIEDGPGSFENKIIDFKDEDIHYMVFAKQGDNFYVAASNEKKNRNTNFMECDLTGTIDNFVIDSIGDGSKKIARQLKAINNYEITEGTLEERKNTIGNSPFISIQEGEKDKIVAYIRYNSENKKTSQALACNILNELLIEFPKIVKTAIVPYYKQESQDLKILKTDVVTADNVGIVLLVPQDETDKIVRAIGRAINKK